MLEIDKQKEEPLGSSSCGLFLRILQGIGGGAESAAEGKDLCEALFELAKKFPEREESKVAEKRKNLKKGNCL